MEEQIDSGDSMKSGAVSLIEDIRDKLHHFQWELKNSNHISNSILQGLKEIEEIIDTIYGGGTDGR